MKLGICTLGVAALLTSSTYLIAADPAPATTAPTGASLKMHKMKLDKPWSEIKDLTPEQTDKIELIHADALEQEKKIKEKETDDIAALLTPAQVEEVKAAKARDAVETKERAAERAKKKLGEATTMPTK